MACNTYQIILKPAVMKKILCFSFLLCFVVQRCVGMERALEEVMYNQIPDCVALGFATGQPAYTYAKAKGGGPCKCDTTTPGYVYAWSVNGDNTRTKIGCASGTTNDHCKARIKQEMNGGTSFWYFCVAAASTDSYTRHLFGGGSYTLDACNAREVKAQDYYYCQGTWLGPQGTGGVGHPAAFTGSGKSEWFASDIDTVGASL